MGKVYASHVNINFEDMTLTCACTCRCSHVCVFVTVFEGWEDGGGGEGFGCLEIHVWPLVWSPVLLCC